MGSLTVGGALCVSDELRILELCCDRIPVFQERSVPFLRTSHLAGDSIPSALRLGAFSQEACSRS